MNSALQKTTKGDQKIAHSSISNLKAASERIHRGSKAGSITIKLLDSDEAITVPKKALILLFDILSNMAEGKSVTLISSDSEISTQEAAEMLQVSRPFFVKLLEKGEIPYKKVGSHRRVLLQDLVSYEAKFRKNRDRQLRFLAKQAQDLNLGYE